MEFARTELPHSGLLTTVPDWPYALLHSQVVKQHFCSCWCWWCPCGCYCFHPDPLLFPGAPACSVSGCTDSNVTAPEHWGEWADVALVTSLWAGGTACLTLFLMQELLWDGCWAVCGERDMDASHGAGTKSGWLSCVQQGGRGPSTFGAGSSHFSGGLCVIDEMGSGEWGGKAPVGPVENRHAILSSYAAGIQGSEGFGRGQWKCFLSQWEPRDLDFLCIRLLAETPNTASEGCAFFTLWFMSSLNPSCVLKAWPLFLLHLWARPPSSSSRPAKIWSWNRPCGWGIAVPPGGAERSRWPHSCWNCTLDWPYHH